VITWVLKRKEKEKEKEKKNMLNLWRQASKPSYHEQIELQAKLLNYFLGSNKSNINQ